MSVVVTEYGRRIDCAKNGCLVIHSDNGEVYPPAHEPLKPQAINGHAVTVVTRTLTYSDWVKA